jgi:acyl-CoA thioesterase FadM
LGTKKQQPEVIDVEGNGQLNGDVKKEAGVKQGVPYKDFDPEGIVHENVTFRHLTNILQTFKVEIKTNIRQTFKVEIKQTYVRPSKWKSPLKITFI